MGGGESQNVFVTAALIIEKDCTDTAGSFFSVSLSVPVALRPAQSVRVKKQFSHLNEAKKTISDIPKISTNDKDEGRPGQTGQLEDK